MNTERIREKARELREKAGRARENVTRRKRSGFLQFLLDAVGAEEVASSQHSNLVRWMRAYDKDVTGLCEDLGELAGELERVQEENRRLQEARDVLLGGGS